VSLLAAAAAQSTQSDSARASTQVWRGMQRIRVAPYVLL